jgi:hypothetical protein
MNSPGTSPIPEGSILLHVGMHKTGTTAIQAVLTSLRPQLATLGVDYPTQEPGHHLPARAVLELRAPWRGSAPDPRVWDEFVRLVDASTAPRRVISSERFSAADDDQVSRIATDLGPDRLHVVIGARHLALTGVSLWQQSLKRGKTDTLDQWLAERFLRTYDNPIPRFWRLHDPGVVAERWASVLGPDRVSVIVVDEQDRDLLPAAFENLLALPPGTLSSATVPVSNRSMTAAEAELSRLTNVALKKQLKWSEYEAFARLGAMSRMTEQRRPDKDEQRIPVPGWMADMALGEGARVAATLTATGVNVIGDLGNLTKAIPAHRLTEVAVAPPTQVPVQAAVEAVAGAVLAGREERRRLRQKLKATRQALGEGRVDQLNTRQLARILWHRLALATKRRIFRR